MNISDINATGIIKIQNMSNRLISWMAQRKIYIGASYDHHNNPGSIPDGYFIKYKKYVKYGFTCRKNSGGHPTCKQRN